MGNSQQITTHLPWALVIYNIRDHSLGNETNAESIHKIESNPLPESLYKNTHNVQICVSL